MTDDKRKKIELCFDSVEKLVTLKAALSRAVANISINPQTKNPTNVGHYILIGVFFGVLQLPSLITLCCSPAGIFFTSGFSFLFLALYWTL